MLPDEGDGMRVSMIRGIGTDIVDINRIKKACEIASFIKKYYTSEEIISCNGRFSSLAGNFAIKESVAKALGTGFRNFEPINIEVLRDDLGKPYVNLYGKAKERLEVIDGNKIYASISHEKDYAVGFVLIEG